MTLKEKELIHRAIIAVTGVSQVVQADDGEFWRLIDDRNPLRVQDLCQLEIVQHPSGLWDVVAATACGDAEVNGTHTALALGAAITGAIYDAEEQAHGIRDHADRAARRLHELRPRLHRGSGHG